MAGGYLMRLTPEERAAEMEWHRRVTDQSNATPDEQRALKGTGSAGWTRPSKDAMHHERYQAVLGLLLLRLLPRRRANDLVGAFDTRDEAMACAIREGDYHAHILDVYEAKVLKVNVTVEGGFAREWTRSAA